MQNSIIITQQDKLQSLIGIVNDVSPFLVKNLYAHMKRIKPAIWSAHCNEQDEKAAEYMIGILQDSIYLCLAQSVINDIDSRLTLALEYQTQAQYDQLDNEAQQDQDAFWERGDAQSAFDDRLAMYHNEY